MEQDPAQTEGGLYYDADGNRTRHWRRQYRTESGVTVERTVSEAAAFYNSADGKLAVAQRHDARGSDLWGAFEEHRYDALGRRVMRRIRQDSVCTAHCTSAIERYVWDGDQLLHELRQPGGNSANVDASVSTGSGAQYGQVTYIHGGAIDRPLGLIRARHSGGTHLVVPHTNFRGLYDSGTTQGGQRIGCSGAAGTSCIGTIRWPGIRLSAYLAPGAPSDPGDWFGSLIGEMTDASGLMYRRNRYYDPQSGQFTQEDPIGLAGGLNLYGYANGDPVNFSDPFGLCVPWPSCALLAGRAGSAVGTLVGAGVGALGGGVGALPGAALGNRIGWVAGAGGATLGAAWLLLRDGDLPAGGSPNSSAVRDHGNGHGQIRDYGSDGKAKTDYDFGHDHTGAGDPHAHDWDWSQSPPRQAPRPTRPNETAPNCTRAGSPDCN